MVLGFRALGFMNGSGLGISGLGPWLRGVWADLGLKAPESGTGSGFRDHTAVVCAYILKLESPRYIWMMMPNSVPVGSERLARLQAFDFDGDGVHTKISKGGSCRHLLM